MDPDDQDPSAARTTRRPYVDGVHAKAAPEYVRRVSAESDRPGEPEPELPIQDPSGSRDTSLDAAWAEIIVSFHLSVDPEKAQWPQAENLPAHGNDDPDDEASLGVDWATEADLDAERDPDWTAGAAPDLDADRYRDVDPDPDANLDPDLNADLGLFPDPDAGVVPLSATGTDPPGHSRSDPASAADPGPPDDALESLWRLGGFDVANGRVSEDTSDLGDDDSDQGDSPRRASGRDAAAADTPWRTAQPRGPGRHHANSGPGDSGPGEVEQPTPANADPDPPDADLNQCRHQGWLIEPDEASRINRLPARRVAGWERNRADERSEDAGSADDVTGMPIEDPDADPPYADPEERFIPPPPPPLPRISRATGLGVAAIAGGLALFVWPQLMPAGVDTVLLVAFGCIVAGFVTLIWRLRPDDDDDTDDDGARI
jgi:hypothetical protein